MQEVLAELRSRGIPYGPMSINQFAKMMAEMTGEAHLPTDSPEQCARRWLPKLKLIEH
jgi:hypothetical protein